MGWQSHVFASASHWAAEGNFSAGRSSLKCPGPSSDGVSLPWSECLGVRQRGHFVLRSDSSLDLTGESIPIRLFLAGYELTPTMRDINKKFSVRYYLNLVRIDEEERRYFKQQVKPGHLLQTPGDPSNRAGSPSSLRRSGSTPAGEAARW